MPAVMPSKTKKVPSRTSKARKSAKNARKTPSRKGEPKPVSFTAGGLTLTTEPAKVSARTGKLMQPVEFAPEPEEVRENSSEIVEDDRRLAAFLRNIQAAYPKHKGSLPFARDVYENESVNFKAAISGAVNTGIMHFESGRDAHEETLRHLPPKATQGKKKSQGLKQKAPGPTPIQQSVNDALVRAKQLRDDYLQKQVMVKVGVLAELLFVDQGVSGDEVNQAMLDDCDFIFSTKDTEELVDDFRERMDKLVRLNENVERAKVASSPLEALKHVAKSLNKYYDDLPQALTDLTDHLINTYSIKTDRDD